MIRTSSLFRGLFKAEGREYKRCQHRTDAHRRLRQRVPEIAVRGGFLAGKMTRVAIKEDDACVDLHAKLGLRQRAFWGHFNWPVEISRRGELSETEGRTVRKWPKRLG